MASAPVRGWLVLCSLLPLFASRADAQQIITARVQGGDVVIEGDTGTCSGDLRRGTANLFGVPGLPIVATGITCPYTVVGDGGLIGSEGGVYYVLSDPATGLANSNMAARFERHVDVTSLPDNTYLVSLPLMRSIPDVANTAGPEADKCVGDAGGPGAPDGIVTADDLLCSWWTSRVSGQGSMLIARWDVPTQAWQERAAFVDAGGLVQFSGTWIDPVTDVSEGYLVTVDGVVGTQNHFLIAGAHDPRWTGRAIDAVPPGTSVAYLLSVPFHTMMRDANEFLCGLEGVGWVDGNGDGNPDTCPGDVAYDGLHATAVVMRDSIPDGSLGDGAWIARIVSHILGSDRFSGTNFDFPRGDALFLSVSQNHAAATFILPHF